MRASGINVLSRWATSLDTTGDHLATVPAAGIAEMTFKPQIIRLYPKHLKISYNPFQRPTVAFCELIVFLSALDACSQPPQQHQHTVQLSLALTVVTDSAAPYWSLATQWRPCWSRRPWCWSWWCCDPIKAIWKEVSQLLEQGWGLVTVVQTSKVRPPQAAWRRAGCNLSTNFASNLRQL